MAEAQGSGAGDAGRTGPDVPAGGEERSAERDGVGRHYGAAMDRIASGAAEAGGNFQPSPPPDDLIAAATVVALRDGPAGLETLMLRRSRRGVFAGVWVFPGGQVDAGDVGSAPLEPTAPPDPIDPAVPAATAAARRAAVREAREEAALALDPESLVLRSFWVPPIGTPRRFATWFFLADAAGAPEVVVDMTEIREHRWMTPAAALAARQAGEIELVPPTFMTLWWLAGQASTGAALATARREPLQRFSTRLVTEDGRLVASVWEGDAGYSDGDLSRPGPRRRLLMGDGGWQAEVDL